MSKHLSSEQIAGWVMGEPGAETLNHAGSCEACSAEIDRLKDSLDLFRTAMRETAGQLVESRGTSQRVLQMPRRRTSMIYLTAAAALLILTALPIYQIREGRQKAAEIARQDAELMDEVNAELSQDVAEPMKPLEKLVSWGPAAQTVTAPRSF